MAVKIRLARHGAKKRPYYRIIVADSFAFKDMNENGTLDPFEDWRLAPETRAADLVGRKEKVNGLPESPDGLVEAFRSGLIDNPFQYKAP